MSVETSVENKVCGACGADVRPGALFCYSCGSAVAAEAAVENKEEKSINNDSDNELVEMPIAKPDEKIETGKPFKKPPAEPLAAKDKGFNSKKAESKDKKLVVEKETTLKTAASVRRQAKPQSKVIEVSWEEEDSPNLLFIIAALILTLLAVGALLAMLYLR